jgi:hypothetical protein
MATLTETVHALTTADPQGGWLRRMFEQLEDVHWGAVRAPGVITAGPVSREVPLVDGPMNLPCVIETDTLLVALEDARTTPLATGTTADAKRHHVSRAIEALRVLAKARAEAEGLTTDPLFGVIVVAGPAFAEPHRTTILEGVPHIEREQAEDLYANYWGRIDPAAFEALGVSRA